MEKEYLKYCDYIYNYLISWFTGGFYCAYYCPSNSIHILSAICILFCCLAVQLFRDIFLFYSQKHYKIFVQIWKLTSWMKKEFLIALFIAFYMFRFQNITPEERWGFNFSFYWKLPVNIFN